MNENFTKYKRYIKLNDGTYQLISHWTSSNTVHFDDGNTAQSKLGAINGITDSLTSDSSNVALSAVGGKNLQTQISELNSILNKTKIESSFTSLHFFKFEEKIELGEYPYNKTAVYGLHSLSQFLNTEASEMYLGYVIESFPTEPMIPFVIPCLLSTQDFSVTQVSSIYIKSDGGVYLSVPSALKSTVFNNILVNSVYWGYYGR